MNLYGTKKYAYGNTFNPMTEKQKKIINIIDEYLGIRFEGYSSKEAYSFIGKYHDFVKIVGNTVYVRKSKNSNWRPYNQFFRVL